VRRHRAAKAVIRAYQNTVQRQLEQIRPTGLERVRRVQDGDELDLNAVIEARQDIRAGQSPNERVYSRKERVQRDVSAIFLVDLSASTDDPIHPPEPKIGQTTKKMRLTRVGVGTRALMTSKRSPKNRAEKSSIWNVKPWS
jgi:nitric oxide reductase activation protein